jgi:hypothetical protein
MSLKLLDLLWCKVAVVLSWVNLESLTININIGFEFFHPWKFLFSNQSLSRPCEVFVFVLLVMIN